MSASSDGEKNPSYMAGTDKQLWQEASADIQLNALSIYQDHSNQKVKHRIDKWRDGSKTFNA